MSKATGLKLIRARLDNAPKKHLFSQPMFLHPHSHPTNWLPQECNAQGAQGSKLRRKRWKVSSITPNACCSTSFNPKGIFIIHIPWLEAWEHLTYLGGQLHTRPLVHGNRPNGGGRQKPQGTGTPGRPHVMEMQINLYTEEAFSPHLQHMSS